MTNLTIHQKTTPPTRLRKPSILVCSTMASLVNIYYMFQVPTTVTQRFLFYLISTAMAEPAVTIFQTRICDRLPDQENFLLCYPQGSSDSYGSGHWNVVRPAVTIRSTADDTGFVSAMITSISSSYQVDSTRIYACGYSNVGE